MWVLFFDDFDFKPANEILHIVDSCFLAFFLSYIPIVNKRINIPFTDEQKNWQQVRRGRYVEFNLVIDRGTQFGLQTPGARIESILLSLPMTASWLYQHHPEPGSEEDKLIQVLKNPKDWAWTYQKTTLTCKRLSSTSTSGTGLLVLVNYLQISTLSNMRII